MSQREVFPKMLDWEGLDDFRGFLLQSMTKNSCEKWTTICKLSSLLVQPDFSWKKVKFTCIGTSEASQGKYVVSRHCLKRQKNGALN